MPETPFIYLPLQLQWHSVPECFLPKSLRGAPISHLEVSSLDLCTELQPDEGMNAASTSHNFLMHGMDSIFFDVVVVVDVNSLLGKSPGKIQFIVLCD